MEFVRKRVDVLPCVDGKGLLCARETLALRMKWNAWGQEETAVRRDPRSRRRKSAGRETLGVCIDQRSCVCGWICMITS